MQISSSQARAVAHGDGPCMVLAGPGSGKTLVITSRIRTLLERKGADPRSILVITFTKAAADQMRQRFFSLMGATGQQHPEWPVVFGTFHAVFFQILKAAYHFRASNILQEEKRLQIIRDLAGQLRITGEDTTELCRNLSSELTKVKNEQIPLEHFYSGVCCAERFRDFFAAYQSRLQGENLLDFDDLLVYTARLLHEREDIRRAWQGRFSYIMVDEFQDINALQFDVVKMLAAPENNLFVVGDDDQSIYRFRGAKPEIMLGFEKAYPGAAILTLEENYRSTGNIILAASRVIKENRVRFQKQINLTRPEGPAVVPKGMGGQREEALYVIDRIRLSHKKGIPYQEMAVLTRTNQGGRFLSEQLMAYQIPFRMKDVMPCLYDHWIARDVFTYIRLAMGSRERKDLLQVMNRPLRYLSRDALITPRFDFEQLTGWYEEKPWMLERIAQLEEDLDRVGEMKPFAAVNYIRFGIDYEQYLSEYAKERHIQEEDLEEVISELQESAKGYDTFAAWADHIETVRRELKEKKQERRISGQDEDAVWLMTLHSAKGLEFEEVFLPDLNEGTLPWHHAVLEADLEEERRLLYVGMTRAKKRLHLLYLREKNGKAMVPSRFLLPLMQR